MVSRTAEDVAAMEQELYELRTNLDSVTRSLELMTQERNRMQVENALLEGKSRENLVKATRIETILTQVAQMLVTSLKDIQHERETARAVRREEQREQIERTEEPPPAFLRQPPRPPAQGITEAEGQRWRAEALIGAAERVAQRPALPRRPGQMNPDLASRDPRIPQNDFLDPQQQDDDQLRDMASRLDRRG